MLIFDLASIGNRIYEQRRRVGLTQSEAAERAGLSERAYADIERGTANARIISVQKICAVLNVEPNDILTEKPSDNISLEQMWETLQHAPHAERKTAAAILDAYLRSNGIGR